MMLAIELYCRTSFGRMHKGNPDIIELASRIDRTPDAVALKLSNLAALDSSLDRKGMSGFSKLDEEVWTEFNSAPLVFLDRVERMSSDQYISPPAKSHQALLGVREGEDVERLVKVRRHQDFFRRALLVGYDGRCAVTGIRQPELLVASHIVPWAEDQALRLNPSNGILLNALHDRAFDQHFITFTDDLAMVVAPTLQVSPEVRPFFEGRELRLPNRFRPSPEILARHRDRFNEKWAA